jgi:hypothetical protein
MEYSSFIIKERWEITKKLFQLSRSGTKRQAELSDTCNDYRVAYDYITGTSDVLPYVPLDSLRVLRRSLLKLDEKINADTIVEVKYWIQKLQDDAS